jgi:hypothetical protein
VFTEAVPSPVLPLMTGVSPAWAGRIAAETASAAIAAMMILRVILRSFMLARRGNREGRFDRNGASAECWRLIAGVGFVPHADGSPGFPEDCSVDLRGRRLVIPITRIGGN